MKAASRQRPAASLELTAGSWQLAAGSWKLKSNSYLFAYSFVIPLRPFVTVKLPSRLAVSLMP